MDRWWMDECIDGRLDGWVDGRMNRWMDGWVYRWLVCIDVDGCVLFECVDGWINECIYSSIDMICSYLVRSIWYDVMRYIGIWQLILWSSIAFIRHLYNHKCHCFISYSTYIHSCIHPSMFLFISFHQSLSLYIYIYHDHSRQRDCCSIVIQPHPHPV